VYIWHKEKLFDDENGLWHLTYTQKERERDIEIINDRTEKEKNRRRRTGMLSNCLSIQMYYDD
jgi:hypothetical protein